MARQRRSSTTRAPWTLNHPDVYRLLVIDRGWTPDEHEEWLADVLCAQLLDPASQLRAVGRAGGPHLALLPPSKRRG